MIKKLLATALLLVMTFLPVNVYAVVTPGDGGSSPTGGTTSGAGKQDACEALKQLDPSNVCGNGEAGVSSLVKSIINILSVVVGVVGVIFIIISGFKYITSGGDSGSITSAKSTLVYALVGLAIAALAQVLVRFVLKSVG